MKPALSPRITVYAVLSLASIALVALLAGLGRAGIGTAIGLGAIVAALLLAAAGLGLLWLGERARLRVEQTLKGVRTQLDRAHHDVKRIGLDLERLAHLGEQLQGCKALDEAVEVIGLAMRELLPQYDGALYLQAHGRNVLNRAARWGRDSQPFEESFMPDDCWALRRGVLYPDDGHGPTCKHVVADSADRGLCAPLKAADQTFGVLQLHGSAVPSPGERRLAQAIANQLALALANLRLSDLLRQQQVRDPLTGLFNRRALEASLMRECLKARRANQAVAVLMIDLDQFKRFTDRHGHEAGDAALTQIAQQIAQSVGSNDVPCRYGGEEFVVIMPDTDTTRAAEQADAIRRAVKAAHVDFHGRRLDVITVSIGIALFPANGAEPMLVLRAADKALAAAKDAGRDRVELAEPLVVAAGNGGAQQAASG